MKALFYKYRFIFRFLGIFLGTYLVLGFIYSFYLSSYNITDSQPDFITRLVAKQSSAIIEAFGFNAKVIAETHVPALTLYVNQVPVATIVEGCNAVSIIILFIAFVVSFWQNAKKTLLFIFAGIAIIYSVNIIRIAILSYLLYKYPEHSEFAHGVIFPLIIYGIVFLLWLLWIKIITKNQSK